MIKILTFILWTFAVMLIAFGIAFLLNRDMFGIAVLMMGLIAAYAAWNDQP